MPTAANLNLYRGWNSCVGWHCDDETLFGEHGDAKLFVSVSLGVSAVFRWRRHSCPDDEGHLCCLGHGDILVVDGQCQDEFLHRTEPGQEQERINVTFRWIKQHVSSCPLSEAGVACCLPTCAQGSPVSVLGNAVSGVLLAFGFLLGGLCIWGVLVLLVSLLCTRLGLHRCASCWTRPEGGGRWRLARTLGSSKNCLQVLLYLSGIHDLEAIYASLSGTAQSPWLLCMYGLLDSWSTIAGKNNVRPLFLLLWFFLFSRNSRERFWG